MADKIQILYKTAKGLDFPTYNEALLADTIQSIPAVYLAEYIIRDLVAGICSKLNFEEKPFVPVFSLHPDIKRDQDVSSDTSNS